MRTFERLRTVRAFERRALPYVKSLEDWDLLIEIGYHQEQGKLINLKQLLLVAQLRPFSDACRP